MSAASELSGSSGAGSAADDEDDDDGDGDDGDDDGDDEDDADEGSEADDARFDDNDEWFDAAAAESERSRAARSSADILVARFSTAVAASIGRGRACRLLIKRRI